MRCSAVITGGSVSGPGVACFWFLRLLVCLLGVLVRVVSVRGAVFSVSFACFGTFCRMADASQASL